MDQTFIKTPNTKPALQPNDSSTSLTREAILKIERFQNISESSLMDIIASSMIVTYEKGKRLFVQGETPQFFFLVYSGFLKIQRLLPDDRVTLIGIFGQGQSIGEIALQLNSQLPVTAIPLVPCQILKIPRSTYTKLSNSDPHFAMGAAQGISNYSIQFIERMHGNALGRMEQQLESFFDILIKKFGNRDGKWMTLPFPLSRQDIANSLNCRVETVIRTMRKFETDGLIETMENGFRFLPKFFNHANRSQT